MYKLNQDSGTEVPSCTEDNLTQTPTVTEQNCSDCPVINRSFKPLNKLI